MAVPMVDIMEVNLKPHFTEEEYQKNKIVKVIVKEKKDVDLIKKYQPDGRRGNTHINLYAMNFEGYKIKTVLWESDDDKWAERHGSISDEWYDKNIQKRYINKGWEKFWYEDNYDQGEFILIRKPAIRAKLQEENTNPYDKVADMMIKRMGKETRSPFKKKKSRI
jgi:hypothetical protein